MKSEDYKNTASFDTAAKLFMSLAESGDDINELLQAVAEYYAADRAYVFEITEDGLAVDNTYEWCREGVSAEIGNLQNVPIEGVEVWIREFEKSGAFFISSLDEDVEKSSLTYEVLEPQGIESLITAPLYRDGVISGFVGIDNPSRNGHDLMVLKTAASIIYSDIRKGLVEKRKAERTHSIFSSVADSFDCIACINIRTQEVTVYRASEKFKKGLALVDAALNSFDKLAELGRILVHPDDLMAFVQRASVNNIMAGIQNGGVYSIESRIKNPIEGKEEYYRFKYSCVANEPELILLSVENIDEQIRREQAIALAEHKKQLETMSVLSTMAEDFDYIAAVDQKEKTVTTYWSSDKYDELVRKIDKNLPSNEMFDRFINLIVHPDDMQMFREKSDYNISIAMLEEHLNYKFDFRTLYNGREEYYRIKFAYKPDNHDIVIMGLLNIDEQVRREMETAVLKEEIKYKERIEEELRVIGGLANDCVSLYTVNLDADSYKTYLISEEAKEIKPIVESSGTLSSSLRRFADDFLHEEDKEKFLWFADTEHIRQALENTRSHKLMVRRNYRGTWKWLELNMIKVEPVDRPAENVILAFTNRDEQVKQEFKAKQELEDALSLAQAATEAKSTFLFNMSHDIRTPMNAITGFTNMAIKNIDNRDKVLDCLDKTKNAGAMLLSLINSVLEVSRIEAGHATLEEQPGDVYLSFANINATMQELAASKNISLDFNFLDIRDRYVYADFGRCMRVFVNIISNAIKYTPAGGTVKVTCEQAGKAKNGVGTYRYTFTDNGIGMSEEFQKHVFDKFSREESSTVSGIQGTGLGMSVVKSFVDLLGGEISVKSKQGEGTTFTVLLPFRIQEEEKLTDPVTGEIISADGRSETEIEDIFFFGKKVLLVEDNEMNREIAQDILEENGFVVDTAEDGSIAYDIMIMARPDTYDLILMDIQMPIMDGYEATRKIRELSNGVEKIPIIALSANAFAEDKKKSLAAGMNDHVSKPINVQELKASLARFI